MDQHIHKRKRRACDQCRKSKSKCEDPASDSSVDGDTCRNCLTAGHECTYLEPVRKRGPPKGYMGAMEQRLSNAEALLGTLICSNDPRVAAIISDISKDTFASSILTRIKEGQYGIRGRLAREQMESASLDGSQYTFLPPQLSLNSTGEPLSSKLDKVFNAPSLEWQDCLQLRLALGAKDRDSSLYNSSSKTTTSRVLEDALNTTDNAEDDKDELISNDDDVLVQSNKQGDRNPSQSLGNTCDDSSSCDYNYTERSLYMVLAHSLGIELPRWNHRFVSRAKTLDCWDWGDWHVYS